MYEDDFYVSENIIGYTGDLNQKPTVYFQKGNKFGRITQDYPDDRTNEGRNLVRSYADYRIENGKGGGAQEFYNGKVQHESRHAFVRIADGDRQKLATAIAAFPDIKPRHK